MRSLRLAFPNLTVVIRNGAAVLLLALLAGGCGSKGADPATCTLPTDGTRLKAIRLLAEDGAREDLSRTGEWYDSALATYCRFHPAADGVARCLPSVALTWSEGWFADAACTQRVAGARRCLGAPQHATVELAGVCAGPDMIMPYAVYTLGPASVPEVTYSDRSGTCEAIPNDQHATVYPLLSEVPPTELVAATFERMTAPRIQGSELAAEDGTRGRTGEVAAFDTAFGTACEPQVAADGEMRCLPFDAFVSRPSAYANAACTQGMVAFAPRECDPAFRRTHTGVQELEICADLEVGRVFRDSPKTHVHELAAPSTPAEIFQTTYDSNGTTGCVGMPNVYALQFSLAGAEIPAAEFARARDQEIACSPVGASGRRLKAHNLVFDDGTLFSRPHHSTWVDAQTGQDCSFRVAADNVLRCLPNGQWFSEGRYFADAGCTQGLIGVSRCNAYRRGAPKFAIAEEAGSGECVAGGGYNDYRTRVYALGAAVTPGALYVYDANQTPAVCVPYADGSADPLAGALQLYEFRPLGSEVPPTTFVAGSIEGL
jgi:hypothetical protein